MAAGVFSVATTVHADDDVYRGGYINPVIGYGSSEFKGSVANGKEKGGLSGGIEMGYQLHQYLAFEFGAYVFPRAKDTTTNNYALGLGVKGILPMPYSGLSVFGKVGGAYSHVKYKVDANVDGTSVKSGENYHKVAPYGALGVDYAFDQVISLTIEGLALGKEGVVPGHLAGLIGLKYHF